MIMCRRTKPAHLPKNVTATFSAGMFIGDSATTVKSSALR